MTCSTPSKQLITHITLIKIYTGGTLKIYGESLCRDVPYKTLLLSVRDCASTVVREMLDKYGLSRHDPSQWCLLQVTTPPGGQPEQEYVLDDDECPLAILMNHSSGRGECYCCLFLLTTFGFHRC